ncbi:hypothetical protein BH10PLA2_BH10PLA2_25370 [soil metagenome]
MPGVSGMVHHQTEKTEMKTPAQLALEIIEEIMAGGAATHPAGSWLEESPETHLLKAIRHATTHLMILRGIYPPDADHHGKNALCRLAMLLALE